MHLFFRAPSRALLAIAVGLAATFAAIPESGAAPTAGPASVTLTPSPTGADAIVSWSPVTSGPVDLYVVDVFVNGAKTRSAQCGPPCSTRTVRYLTPGQSVRVDVYAKHAGVAGPVTSSPTIVIPNPCATGTVQCIRIDGTSDTGPVTRVAQGFLHANVGSDKNRAAALNPRSWRVRAAHGDYSSFDAARSLGVEVLLLVSDHISLPAQDPAASGTLDQALAAYRDGLRTYVRSLIAAGRVPDLWEIQNEPDLNGWSRATQLAHWKAGYEEIKALLPDAKILGLANGSYMGTPAEATPTGVDLQTFLDFAVTEGLRPDAIGWHENRVARPADFDTQPETVIEHTTWARQILASRGLSEVDIRIDEYGGREDNPIPGWQVGWFNALETAEVDAAEHSCFPFPNGLLEVNGCETPNLNYMVNPSNQAPRANYWIGTAYGRMTGRRLSTVSSTATLTTLATANSAGAISALVGRHVGCVPNANTLCPMGSVNPGPVDVPVSVTVPSSTAALRVLVQRVPFSAYAMAGPTHVSDTVVAANAGSVAFTLPKVADGDALILTLTPTTAPATTTTTSPTTTSPTTTTTNPLTGILQSIVKGLKLF